MVRIVVIALNENDIFGLKNDFDGRKVGIIHFWSRVDWHLESSSWDQGRREKRVGVILKKGSLRPRIFSREGTVLEDIYVAKRVKTIWQKEKYGRTIVLPT